MLLFRFQLPLHSRLMLVERRRLMVTVMVTVMVVVIMATLECRRRAMTDLSVALTRVGESAVNQVNAGDEIVVNVAVAGLDKPSNWWRDYLDG